MAKIASSIDVRSPEFAANRAAMAALVAELRALLERNARGGSEAARNKHREAGKLLARERVDALLDPGSPFLEFSQLAAHGLYDDDLPGAGLVTGIGRISGRACMVVANDPTVKGGTYYPLTVKKHLRAQEIARENALPCVYLVESGGAFLPTQDEVFPDRDHFGRIFFNQARLSAQGIAQIAVVHGSCTAGGAYVPAMSDEAVIVRNQGRIFLGGPPLVRAATGEEIDAESLGGADVHCRRSGVSDHYARERHARARLARRAVARLRPPALAAAAHGLAASPTTTRAELYGVIPPTSRKPYDVREIIARLVDGSWFDEFKALYGTTLVCGFAHIRGMPVGILGQQRHPVLRKRPQRHALHRAVLPRGHPAAVPAEHHRLHGRPAAEAGGIAKDGAKLVTAVACAAVPKLTVIIGGSFGAGNYAMCGRAYSPRLLFQWPNARISVMGGEQAASVLATVKREALQRTGGHLSAAEEEQIKAPIREQYERQGHPYYASARLWDDGVIDPLDTRRALGLALALNSEQTSAATRFGIFRM